MSEALKERIAEDLGVAPIVRSEGWGSVSARDCGNVVRRAIEIAQHAMVQNQMMMRTEMFPRYPRP